MFMMRTSRPSSGTQRKGDRIQTFSGRVFYPLDPRFSEVCVIDIAHMLSMKCRFSGATRDFYSVAQHAILLSHAVPAEFAYAALHHDDSEAYLPAVPSAVKPFLVGFKEIEHDVEVAVCIALHVDIIRLSL